MNVLAEAGGTRLPAAGAAVSAGAEALAAPGAEPPPGWRCPHPRALHCMAWEQDAAVVFDEHSGDTHLLDALSAQALQELIRLGQATRQELAVLLHGRAALEALPALDTALDERLVRLLQRALIEPWSG